MANQKEPFERKRLDEEIEQLAQIQNPELLMEIPEARLINDLRRAHQAESEADVQSLSSVYTRLQAYEHRVSGSVSEPENILPFPRSGLLQEGSRSMNTGVADHTRKKMVSDPTHRTKTFSRSHMTSIAAVLVAGVLLTSALWAFTLLRSSNAGPARKSMLPTQVVTVQKSIHTGKLLCSTSYSTASMPEFGQPALDWSERGVIATAYPLKTFAARTCSPQALVNVPETSLVQPVWSPDGKRLLLLAGDTAKVLDASTGNVIVHLQVGASTDQFWSTVWASDGTQIVSVMVGKFLSSDTTSVKVQIWDARTGALISTPLTFDGVLIGSAWISPNGEYLALQKSDHRIEFWNVKTGKLISTTSASVAGNAQARTWSPDGSALAVSLPNPNWPTKSSEVQIWSTTTGRLTASFKDSGTFEGSINGLAWSPNGKYLAEGSGEIHIWDVASGQLVATFGKIATRTASSGGKTTTYSQIISVAWAPDSSMLASVTKSFDASATTPRSHQQYTLNVWRLS